jgi:hypothetical protein
VILIKWDRIKECHLGKFIYSKPVVFFINYVLLSSSGMQMEAQQPPPFFPPQFGPGTVPPFGMPPPNWAPWNTNSGPTPPWQSHPPDFNNKIDPQLLAKAAEWSEHRAPDGRMYYYHAGE